MCKVSIEARFGWMQDHSQMGFPPKTILVNECSKRLSNIKNASGMELNGTGISGWKKDISGKFVLFWPISILQTWHLKYVAKICMIFEMKDARHQCEKGDKIVLNWAHSLVSMTKILN